MTIVYRKDERFTLSITEGLEFELAPLSYRAKMEIVSSFSKQGGDLIPGYDSVVLAIRHSIKSAKGLQLPDGSDYQLEFKDDVLTEECADDLLNLSVADKVSSACISLINGVPEKVINRHTGEALEGVTIKYKGSSKKKNSG